MSYKLTDFLDGNINIISVIEPTGYVIPQHEEKLIINDRQILMKAPTPPFMLSINKDLDGIVDVEETGLKNIKMLPVPIPVPWRFGLDGRQHWSVSAESRFVHCCDRGGDVFPGRGNLVRRDNTYWCNTCGYATTEVETTSLDFMEM